MSRKTFQGACFKVQLQLLYFKSILEFNPSLCFHKMTLFTSCSSGFARLAAFGAFSLSPAQCFFNVYLCKCYNVIDLTLKVGVVNRENVFLCGGAKEKG